MFSLTIPMRALCQSQMVWTRKPSNRRTWATDIAAFLIGIYAISGCRCDLKTRKCRVLPMSLHVSLAAHMRFEESISFILVGREQLTEIFD